MSDRGLVVTCLFGLTVVALLLAQDETQALTPSDTPRIGTVTQTVGRVQRRLAKQLTWNSVAAGDAANDADTLFVSPNSAAVVYLTDGSRLALEPNTLVVLQTPGIFVQRGGVTAQNLTLANAQGTVHVEGIARVTPTNIDVYTGKATLNTAPVPVRPTQLIAPLPGAVVYQAPKFQFRGPGHVRVDGKPPANIAAGPHTWQVVGDNGEPLSSVATFTLAENPPPRALSPRHLELITQRHFQAIPFAWTATAEQYTLELATDAAFTQPLAAVDTTQPKVWLAQPLPEGVIYWRVRASGREQPLTISATHAFRYSHAALPDAPEVYDAEVDLGAH